MSCCLVVVLLLNKAVYVYSSFITEYVSGTISIKVTVVYERVMPRIKTSGGESLKTLS